MQTNLPRWRVIARLDDVGPLWRVHRAASAAALAPATPAAQLAAPRRAPVTVPLSDGPAPRRLPRRLSAEAWIALLASALSIGAFVWYAHQGQTLAYSDAISHMMIARRVFFSRTPGLAQLGTVWLPLTHMLMLPFIWWDALFRSGLAGALPSMAAYVLGALYLYRLAHLVFGSSAAGVIAALVFLLNPSTLYMQGTPMTELPLMGLAIVAIYYAARWVRTFEAPDLVKCAAATAAATLVRYDAWALAAGLCVILLVAAWRRGGWQTAEANALLYGTFAFSGCVAWLVYQQVILGNALDFLNGPYSSEHQQLIFESRSELPTLHNPMLSFRVYGQAVLDTASGPMITIAAVGLILWAVRARWRLDALPMYAMLIPFAFNWYSLVRGNSILRTPEIPFGGISTYFNVRYGMMMVPAIALFFAYAATRVRLTALAGAALIVVFAIPGTWFTTPYALQDPLASPSRVAVWNTQEAAWLATHCGNGPTLISESGFEVAIFYSRVPLSHYITNGSNVQFQQAMEHPERTVMCLAMDSDSVTFEPVWDGLHNRQDWRPYFKLAAQFGTASFYQRITPDKTAGAALSVRPVALVRRSPYFLIPAQGGTRG